MRKKRLVKKHTLKNDHLYDSQFVAVLINYVMLAGLKEKAMRIVYSTLDDIKKRYPQASPLEVFSDAVENVRPSLALKTRKIGGGNIQVPFEVPHKKSILLGIKEFVKAARKMRRIKGVSMWKALSMEIVDGYSKTGEAFKNNQNLQKMAISNLAFSFQRF